MSKIQIMSIDKAKELFIEELESDKKIEKNYYIKFEEWLADNNYYLKENIIQQEEDKMKEEYLRS